MNKFKKYILAKYPNRSPQILFQLKSNSNADTVFELQEIQDLWDLWQFRQTEVDKKTRSINEALKILAVTSANSSAEAQFYADIIAMLKGKKVYKAPKRKHSHIYINDQCECGWTVEDELRIKKPEVEFYYHPEEA